MKRAVVSFPSLQWHQDFKFFILDLITRAKISLNISLPLHYRASHIFRNFAFHPQPRATRLKFWLSLHYKEGLSKISSSTSTHVGTEPSVSCKKSNFFALSNKYKLFHVIAQIMSYWSYYVSSIMFLCIPM
jgi:hypothetical protein